MARPSFTPSISGEAEPLDFAQKGGHILGASEKSRCSLGVQAVTGGQGAVHVAGHSSGWLFSFPECPLPQGVGPRAGPLAWPMNRPVCGVGQGEEWAGPFYLTFPPPVPPSREAARTLDLGSRGRSVLLSPPLPGTCCQAKKGKNNPSRRSVSGRPRPAYASSSHAPPQAPPPPAQGNFSFLGPGAGTHKAHPPPTPHYSSRGGTPSYHP